MSWRTKKPQKASHNQIIDAIVELVLAMAEGAKPGQRITVHRDHLPEFARSYGRYDLDIVSERLSLRGIAPDNLVGDTLDFHKR